MTPVDIGFWVCIVFWSINYIMEKVTIDNEVESKFYLAMEFICLGFIWIFIGFDNGWW